MPECAAQKNVHCLAAVLLLQADRHGTAEDNVWRARQGLKVVSHISKSAQKMQAKIQGQAKKQIQDYNLSEQVTLLKLKALPP